MKSGGPILNPRRNRWILARLYLTRRLFWLEKNRVEGKILLTLLLSLSLSLVSSFFRKKNRTWDSHRLEMKNVQDMIEWDIRKLISRITIDISDWFRIEQRNEKGRKWIIFLSVASWRMIRTCWPFSPAVWSSLFQTIARSCWQLVIQCNQQKSRTAREMNACTKKKNTKV